MKSNYEAFFLSWPGAFQAGTEAAGGKGWNLGRLDRYGFKIPAGGVLAAGAYLDFVKENGCLVNIEDIAQSVIAGNVGEREIEEKLFQIREKFRVGRISSPVQEELVSKLKNTGILEKPLAVRSSATAEDSSKASFAGVHESFLNVRGIENILSCIKKCYASLWTPRAVAYRRKMNISDEQVIPAVVIMEMVEAKAAGVGFSCHPGTGQEDVLLISANFGLGESVVSGAIEPDEYRLDLMCEIKEKTIGRKGGMIVPAEQGGTEFVKPAGSMAGQVLTDENIVKLGFEIWRVFEALGRGEQHQDVEWVYDGKDFILVQARPVTSVPRYTCAEIKDQPDIWSNANFRDAIPFVQSTLNWSLLKHGLTTILQSPFQAVGCRIPTGLRYVRLYQGRPYINLSLQQWLWYDALGLAPRKTNDSLGGNLPEIKINEKKPYAGGKGLKRVFSLLKFMLAMTKAKRKAKKSFVEFSGYTEDLLRKNFKHYANEDIINTLFDNTRVSVKFALKFHFLSSSAAVSYMMLVNALEKTFPGQGNAIANAIMMGNGDITSAQHGYRLVELVEIARSDANAGRFFAAESFNPLCWDKDLPDNSPFKKSFQNFLAEYGHRGIYEADIINPRWREDPSYLLNIIKSSMETADTGLIKARQKEKADSAWREIKQKLLFHRRLLIKSLLKQALKGAELREMSKSVYIKLFEPGRMFYQEIGRRLTEKGIIGGQADIYHCTLIEIFSLLKGYWDGRGLAALVAERKVRKKEMEALSPPDLIVDEAPHFMEPVTTSPGDALTGMGVAAGRASGTARLIFHPGEWEKLQAGDVLVAPSTDPAWTPLFLRASAIVMETGGFLSHGSIVAREYGVPAVINIPGVMRLLHDGQKITVDGDVGKVYL
jgi:pyruvate,water dikinase